MRTKFYVVHAQLMAAQEPKVVCDRLFCLSLKLLLVHYFCHPNPSKPFLPALPCILFHCLSSPLLLISALSCLCWRFLCLFSYNYTSISWVHPLLPPFLLSIFATSCVHCAFSVWTEWSSKGFSWGANNVCEAKCMWRSLGLDHVRICVRVPICISKWAVGFQSRISGLVGWM